MCRSFRIPLVLLFTLALALPVYAQKVIYVNAARSQSGDGSTWKKAFRTIQEAINSTTNTATQVWVVKGVYHEAVKLKTSVAIFGGFKGSETFVYQRSVVGNITTITSDQSDTITSGTVTMSGTQNSAVDGFTITGELAFGLGGGVACFNADNTNAVRNCILTGNKPLFGNAAGVVSVSSSPAIINCVITQNGGGSLGGGIYLSGGAPAVMNCTLRSNTVNGIAITSGSAPIIINTIIADHIGAGILETSTAGTPVIKNNLFNNNTVAVADVNGTNYTAVNTYNMFGTGATQNFAGDPKFSTSSSTWFEITSGSAAIGRALLAAASGTDIAGRTRVSSKSKTADIGAYEADSDACAASDTTAPVSQVTTLPTVYAGSVLNVPFAASDAQSGIARVLLFYRTNGGSWKQYGRSYVQGPIPFNTFDTTGDGTYQFYTQAVDNAGNTEAAPSQPDASTIVVRHVTNGRLYVNTATHGSGSGESWTDALGSLQNALAIASALSRGTVSQIWVAGGTFKPAAAGGSRDATFRMLSGVSIYGGFVGGETTLAQRKAGATTTTLSGDLNGNDGTAAAPLPAVLADNSRHVIDASGVAAGTALDGVTITGGYADGTGQGGNGAGVYAVAGSPTLQNCIIERNRTADRPAGAATVLDGGGGAGLYFSGASQPAMNNCTVRGNRTGSGGMQSIGSDVVTGNGGNGAGVLAGPAVTLKLTSCTLTGNATGTGGTVFGKRAAGHGGHGAGIYADVGATLTATACRITSNTTGGGVTGDNGNFYKGGSGGSGGGLYAGNAVIGLDRCLFASNSTGAGAAGLTPGAGGDGAGIYALATTGTLTNSIIARNVTGAGGPSTGTGGHGGDGAGVRLANSVLTLAFDDLVTNRTGVGGNHGSSKTAGLDGRGGGAYVAGTGAVLTDCILWNNTEPARSDGQAQLRLANQAPITNCDIQDLPGNLAGSGNIALDPKFVNLAALDLHLRGDSPCIGRGVAVDGVAQDYDGVARPVGNAVDIGAFEFRGVVKPELTLTGPTVTPAGTLTYNLTFTEAVNGVDASDFTLDAPNYESRQVSAVKVSPTTYRITVSLSNHVPTGGAVRLSLNPYGTRICNGAGCELAVGATAPTVTIDPLAPQVQLFPIDETMDNVNSWPQIKLEGTAYDVGTSVSEVWVRVNGGDWKKAQGTGSWTITMAVPSTGPYSTFEVKALDLAGNNSPVVSMTTRKLDLLRTLLGLRTADAWMDINHDGKIDTADLMLAARY